MSKLPIEHFIIMGDSLSDRGTMASRKLFGLIPMDKLSGLTGKSPKGRFTNGYTWSDQVSARIAEELIIQKLKKQEGESSTDIADDVITHNTKEEEMLGDFNLHNDQYVNYKGDDFVRTYDEGGLTAHDYAGKLSWSISRFFSRIILSTLKKKRELLLKHDAQRHLSNAYKAKTLVVEWSGANDLITVNERPSHLEAKHAIAARIRNVEELYNNGYRHFVLFNLPDLSLTPRYQRRSPAERQNAHRTSIEFNNLLQQECNRLQQQYGNNISIDVFDVNETFTDAYKHPEKYKLDPNKVKTPYTESDDFEIGKRNETSPASGYAFWDDVHPTADVHAILADKFYQKYSLKYQFQSPHQKLLPNHQQDLLKEFRKEYQDKWKKDKQGCFGLFRKSHLHYEEATLIEIFNHALFEGGNRTRDVMRNLGWIDKKNRVVSHDPLLRRIMQDVVTKHRAASQTSNVRLGH